MNETRLFDLNIERILEAWDSAHAVRELIANALDEQELSQTGDIEVFQLDDGGWVIRDFGRGLRSGLQERRARSARPPFFQFL